MSFLELGGERSATIPQHNRLKGLEVGNPHPQYAETAHTHDEVGGEGLKSFLLFTGSTQGNLDTRQHLIQAGSSVFTYTAGINGTYIPLPTAFPSGILTAIACLGDNVGPQECIVKSLAASQFSVLLYTSAGAEFGGGLVRVNWVAIGW